MSINKKVLLIVAILVFIASLVGIITLKKYDEGTLTTEYASTSATTNRKAVEEVVTEVVEDVVQVLPDKAMEQEMQENSKDVEEEKVVQYKDKEIKIPKSKVASVNSSEDAERNKKNGGNVVSQNEANTMFENTGTHSNGIDVSAHQGVINWQQVAASGVDFAIIRVGFRGQSAGGIYEDAYFKRNVAGATANGIKVGIYFYSTAVNENEALEEAAWVVNKISTYRITYPVVYDFEDFGAYRCAGVGGAQATSNALTFLNFVKANGYEPMMYANKSDITSRMNRGSFPCKFWLAHYTSKSDYAGSYQMWQYTSKGSVPGISGRVDMDIAYFSYGATAAAKHTHVFSEEVKNSYKAPTCGSAGQKIMRCACGETQTESIPATGKHTYGEWHIDKEATETENGSKSRICSGCKDKETVVIKATGSYSNVQNTNSSSNSGSGTSGQSENMVNKIVKDPENPTEHHTHDYSVFVRTVDPTCEEKGFTEYKCSVCDEKEKRDYKDALGHKYGEWVTVKEPTVDEEGLEERTCSCGKKDTRKINKLTPPPTTDENVVQIENVTV